MTENRNFIDRFAKSGATRDTKKMDEFFNHFDQNKDGKLDRSEFVELMRALVDSESEGALKDGTNLLFAKFDKNGDKQIDQQEFRDAWLSWFPRVLDPVLALVVVDVQNDFISGTLALKYCEAKEDGADVVAPINRMAQLPALDVVVYTLDWHPANHVSFYENRAKFTPSSSSPISDPNEMKPFDKVIYSTDFGEMEQILWPAHCIQNSTGSELDTKLIIPERKLQVLKGENVQLDSYSAFFDNNKVEKTILDKELRQRNVTHVLTCGLATDVCVHFTAMDGLSLGYRVALIEDASRGVDSANIIATKSKFVSQGGLIIQSSDVQRIAEAKYRPLAWALAD